MMTTKGIDDSIKRINEAVEIILERHLSEQEKHMRDMFEECGYSYEEVVDMMKSGEMVGVSNINGYGFTEPTNVTTYNFYIHDEKICSFFVYEKMVTCANSKAGYGISMEVVRAYDHLIYKTREKIENAF